MNDLYIYETKLPDVIGTPFIEEQFYAIVILFSLLVLFVAFSRRKKNDDDYLGNSNLRNYDVLSQPIQWYDNDQFSNNGVLFNTGSRIGFLKSMVYSMLACLIFGIVVFCLKISHGNLCF